MITGLFAGAIVFLLLVTIAFAVDPFTPFDFGKLVIAATLCFGWGGLIGWAVA